MEEKIKMEIKKINKMTESVTRKYNKSIKEGEKQVLHTKLARLDGKFEAYMEVLNMIKEVE